jgi:hypothetical protein
MTGQRDCERCPAKDIDGDHAGNQPPTAARAVTAKLAPT